MKHKVCYNILDFFFKLLSFKIYIIYNLPLKIFRTKEHFVDEKIRAKGQGLQHYVKLEQIWRLKMDLLCSIQ